MSIKEQNNFDVIKIGGAVLKNKEGFHQITEILRRYYNNPTLIVISALSTATRNLKRAAKTAESGDETEARKIIDEIIELHSIFASELFQQSASYDAFARKLEECRKELYDYAKGLSITRELTARTLDAVMSYGEFFALRAVYYYLIENEFDIEKIEATRVIVSDSNYGGAKPIYGKTKAKVDDILIPALRDNEFVLTQGFIAKSERGELTTMGIESSSLTAALLSDMIGAKEITFWTDVEGIKSADPKLVPEAKPIRSLNYKQAYAAGVNGIKLLYPKMIEQAAKTKTLLTFRSALNPEGDRSVVSADQKGNPKIIILNENLIKLNYEFSSTAEIKNMKNFLSENSAVVEESLFQYHAPNSFSLILPEDSTVALSVNKIGFEKIKNVSSVALFNFEKDRLINIIPELKEIVSQNGEFELEIGDNLTILFVDRDDAPKITKYLHDRIC